MAATGVEVTLRQGRERAEVTRFTSTLTSVVKALREIDGVHLLRGTRATWVLARVSQVDSELIVVRLEARPVPLDDRDADDMAVAPIALVSGVETLRTESTVPDLFAASTVRRVAELARPTQGVQTVSLATYNGQTGKVAELTEDVRKNADAAIHSSDQSYGSVVGRVSTLREARKGTGTGFQLTIRDERLGQAIDARLPQSLESAARDAWRHRYLVAGQVRRNSEGQAISIAVERLEPMPETNAGRPSADEMLGIGSAWLGGQSVDEYLSATRHG